MKVFKLQYNLRHEPDLEAYRQNLLNASQAMQRGDRQAARLWAEKAAAEAPDKEDPWLFLAALSSPRASIAYLERALKINPQSDRARKGHALGCQSPA